jgi:cytochrome c-type biogenesis protein CcmH
VTPRARSLGAWCGVVLSLLAAAPAAGQTADSAARPAPDSAVARDTALERRVNEVSHNLRCPVCQNLSILDSPSELAQDMKRLVREQLAAGRSREEIEAFFVARYGEWVLLKPSTRGANLTVWLLPALVLGGGALLLSVAVRRWTRGTRAGAGAAAPVAEPAAETVASGTPAELQERRDTLRRTLAELDEDFAEGKVTQEDYETFRRRDEAALAAVRKALQDRKAAERKAASPAAAAAGGGTARRRVHPALAYGAGLLVFGAVAAVALRGSVGARSEGGTITGIDFGGGAAAPDAPASEAVDPAVLAALEARVARDSNDHAALLELGHLYLKQQRLQRAATVSMKAVQLRPKAKETAEAFAHLGMVLWGANELETGLRAIEQALFLSPDLPEALLYKGLLLFAGANQPAQAVAAWERYLQVAPPGAETARVRGMLEAARQAAAQPAP